MIKTVISTESEAASDRITSGHFASLVLFNNFTALAIGLISEIYFLHVAFCIFLKYSIFWRKIEFAMIPHSCRRTSNCHRQDAKHLKNLEHCVWTTTYHIEGCVL